MRTVAHVSALRPLKDSVNWSAIPVGTPLVAGYVPPSHFAWPPEAWARFAGSIEVRITPSASVHGLGIQVLDIETGDATPAQAPGWVNASRAAGQEGTCYCSIATWPAVIRAINTAGIKVHPPYWVAGYPGGGPILPSITVDGRTYTATAHQYADPNSGSGGDWDSSVVADFWPGVDTGADMPLTQADIAAIWAYRFAGTDPLSQTQMPPIAASDWIATTNRWANAAYEAATQDDADIQAAQAALLAAFKAIPAGTVDPTALATALEAGGFPTALVAALLAVLNKAATGGTKS